MTTDTVIICVSMPKRLARRLAKLAKDRMTTVSAVIREMIIKEASK